ncbi:MAG: hypothetical protein F6K31_16635 [Symploca sp. SIO2G7]|nr:hypothetical protein [Symploca sp. SIO2G7]
MECVWDSLGWVLALSVSLVGTLALPVKAQETASATTVPEWLAQIEASLVHITDVRLETLEGDLH